MPPTLGDLEQTYFPFGGFLGTPHSADTVVTMHIDGEAFFDAIADVLDTCTGGGFVYIASWWFDPDTVLRTTTGSPKIGTILVDLADAGVDVRLILATPRYSVGIEGLKAHKVDFWLAAASIGGAAFVPQINVRAGRALRASKRGGKTPLEGRVLMDWGGRADTRHEKSVIVYSATTGKLHAFVSGLDFAPLRLTDDRHVATAWHDVGVELEAGAAAAVLGNFRTRWTETATLPTQRCMLDGVSEVFNPVIEPTNTSAAPVSAAGVPANVPPGSYLGTSVRVLRSYEGIRAFSPWGTVPDLPWATLPASGIKEIRTAVENAIDKAATYIYVEDQTLNPSTVTAAYQSHKILYPRIADACARGVKVIFVTQGIAGSASPVATHLAMSAEIEDLILDQLSAAERDNFALYYVNKIKVHSKLVMVDDEFLSIGSANFWDRSMTGVESELNAMIVHPGVANSMIADVRIRLWCEHLRVWPSAPVEADVRDLSKSLAIFRPSWGSGVTFPHPHSALVEIPQ